MSMLGGPLDEPNDEDDDAHADLNVTPLIDVMLVLLIIFMVAAPLSTVDVPVDLPTSTARPTPRSQAPVFVTLDAELRRSVGETPTTPETFLATLDARTDGKRDVRVYLRVDRTVSFDAVMQLTNSLRAAGYLKIAFVGLEGRTEGSP
jgi:biopolymer transport protein ExbD